jgi:dTDP-4-dehydrorhamnose reductase
MGKILVFGAAGQLGMCIKTVAEEQSLTDIVFLSSNTGDILDLEHLETLIESARPAFVINCAAYTAVDKAEDDTARAISLNRDGAENLARICNKHAVKLIHVSTDFVFDGSKPKLLSEDDLAGPLGVYGRTKLEGEQAIAEHLKEFFILRTSWLYSEFGNNFVKTMLKFGKERDELKIIADQVGTPTYGIDLAQTIFSIINSQSVDYGVYHYSNEGLASWYDFAKAIFEIANISVRVKPVTTSEYITRAVRPAFSVMNKDRIKKAFNIEIPYWRDSLVACIQKLEDASVTRDTLILP